MRGVCLLKNARNSSDFKQIVMQNYQLFIVSVLYFCCLLILFYDKKDSCVVELFSDI